MHIWIHTGTNATTLVPMFDHSTVAILLTKQWNKPATLVWYSVRFVEDWIFIIFSWLDLIDCSQVCYPKLPPTFIAHILRLHSQHMRSTGLNLICPNLYTFSISLHSYILSLLSFFFEAPFHVSCIAPTLFRGAHPNISMFVFIWGIIALLLHNAICSKVSYMLLSRKFLRTIPLPVISRNFLLLNQESWQGIM